jgi:hypothetical protein
VRWPPPPPEAVTFNDADAAAVFASAGCVESAPAAMLSL